MKSSNEGDILFVLHLNQRVMNQECMRKKGSFVQWNCNVFDKLMFRAMQIPEVNTSRAAVISVVASGRTKAMVEEDIM